MAEKLHTRLDREAKERGLWERPRAEVRDDLILLYLPFAEQLGQMAAERNPNVDRDDAIQEATIGLIQAVDAFDLSNGALPSTFLGWRIRGGAVEAARKCDFVSHKIRAEDKALRARAAAGDESVRACDLLPEMNSVAFESSHNLIAAGLGLSEPENRPELSDLERDTLHLEKMLEAVDPVIAGYTRDYLEAQRHPDVRAKRTDAAAVLSRRWKTTPEGAGAIVRSCVSQLQNVSVV